MKKLIVAFCFVILTFYDYSFCSDNKMNENDWLERDLKEFENLKKSSLLDSKLGENSKIVSMQFGYNGDIYMILCMDGMMYYTSSQRGDKINVTMNQIYIYDNKSKLVVPKTCEIKSSNP